MLDVSKLTDTEVLQLWNQIRTVTAKQPVSAALAPEWEDAQALAITDGTNPNVPATRAQVAAMIVRASVK